MKSSTPNEINNNAPKINESFSLSNPLKPILKPKSNFVLCCETNKLDAKKEIKFITKKRGRKCQFQPQSIDKERKFHDKSSNDNIRRKIKSLFHKYIIYLLNYLIKQKYKRIKMKFLKMNIRITKDVGIEYNRDLLNRPIKNIIVNISKKYRNQNNNKNCIKFIEAQKDNKEIIEILNMTYKDLYTNYYLKSNKNSISNHSYETHKEILLNKYGEKYLQLFIENSEKFVEFFIYGRKRKLRKLKEVESINISFENNFKEKQTNESVNFKNVENYFLNKNMVSCPTETDICGINKKLLVFS